MGDTPDRRSTDAREGANEAAAEPPPSSRSLLSAPPDASPTVQRWAKRFVAPIESFLHVEASSGIVLLLTAAIALVLANSSFGGTFHEVLAWPLGLRIGPWQFEMPLHFVVNDGLMTIFFFVVGLEIRREIHEGELSNLRRAMLPLAAALGGMIMPALLYLLVAGHRPEDRSGWGVPMATDIAFAVGALAILGKRVPPALRVLLLALAIIDDIGSIVVIATFYSGAISGLGLLLAGLGMLGIVLLQRAGVRSPWVYLIPGAVVWLGIFRSGVHPTLAGVIVGLMTPAKAWLGPAGLVGVVRRSAEHVDDELGAGDAAPGRLAHEAARIALASREALSPATRLQTALHPWVAFGIMPIFALANAGVTLHGAATRPSLLALGIVVGLVVGKPLGVVAATALVVRARIAILPRGIGWREILVLGLTAGIGFTMALFVAELAFSDATKLQQAKLAILVASVAAVVLGLTGGRLLLRATPMPGAATCASDAEASDEI